MARKYDERFDELTGLVKKVVGRVDEMQLEMRDMRMEAGGLRDEMRSNQAHNLSRFDKIDASLEVASALHDDMVPKVIGIQKAVNQISETQADQKFKLIELMNRTVERRLKAIDERTVEMDAELKSIRKAIDALIDPVLDGKPLSANLSHLEERIARLEEKVS